MYFSALFVYLDNFILVVMAYDHFVAICHHKQPALYFWSSVTTSSVFLVVVSWITSALNSLLLSPMVLQLSCTVVEISHYFYEPNQLFQLACSDTFLINMVM
jgi:olfactory receptor